MCEITSQSASALARQIGQGELTCVEVVSAYLRRIEAVDPEVCAYVSLLADRALAAARARDAELGEGRARGPIHGVPVAIKDIIAVEGVAMTAGTSFLQEAPSAVSAQAVARLESAGAIVLGTATLHEFALGMTSVNPHGRTPRNPWDVSRVAGGSSGGSAVAVAAGVAAGALGTDTGGSIRIPAALCGVVGLKPTFGRVSRAGVLPLASSFDTVGPIARTVEDVALMLEAIAGFDPQDPASARRPVDTYQAAVLARRPRARVARLVGPLFEDDLDPAVSSAVEVAALACERAGLPVRPVSLRTAEAAGRAQVALLLAEAAAFHRAAYPGKEGYYGRDVRTLLERGAGLTADELSRAEEVARAVRAELADILGECDVLLGPALPGGAPLISEVDPDGEGWPEIRSRLGRFSRIYNLAGLPAVVVPAGATSAGLPVAVQLAGREFSEGLVLAVARVIEEAVGWVIPGLPESRSAG